MQVQEKYHLAQVKTNQSVKKQKTISTKKQTNVFLKTQLIFKVLTRAKYTTFMHMNMEAKNQIKHKTQLNTSLKIDWNNEHIMQNDLSN